MKFQILNNEQIGFYNDSGNLTSIIKPSGSNLVIYPVSTDGDIELGQNGTVNDVELGNLATPVNMTFLGGGTITPNGNTLYIGDSNAGDSVVLSNVTIGSSVVWSTGLSGSFSGSHYGSFYGDGRGLVGITATVEPAGPIGSIQFNDNINNSGSSDFTFNKTTNTVTLTGSLNVSGSTTADFFFGNGAGLTGITSTFAPTGQDKSLQFNKGGTEISGSDGILFDYDNNNLNVKGYISASLLTGSAILTGSFTGDLNGDGANITNVVGNTTFTGNPEIVGDLNITGTVSSTGIDVTGSVVLSGSSDTSEIRIMDPAGTGGLLIKDYGFGNRLGFYASRGYAGGFGTAGIHWSNTSGGSQDVVIDARNGGSLRGNNNVALQWAENGIRGNINFDNASTNTYFTTAGSTNRSLHFPGTGGQSHWTFRNQMGQSYGIQLRNSDTNDSVTILATSSPSPPEDQIIMRIDKSATNGNYGGGGFIRYDATLNNRVYTFGNPFNERSDESGVNVKITAGAAGTVGTRNGGNVYLVPTTGSNGGTDGVVDVGGNLIVKGSEVDFTNLPTSDPGVAGRLFQTGSDAIGASPGFQVVVISQG